MVPGRVTIAVPARHHRPSCDSAEPRGRLSGPAILPQSDIRSTASRRTSRPTRLDSSGPSSPPPSDPTSRREAEECGNCNCGPCKVEAVTRIANALRSEPQRRKTVFFVGEQFPLSRDSAMPTSDRRPGRCCTRHTSPMSRFMPSTRTGSKSPRFRPATTSETTPAREQRIGGSASEEEANRVSLIERQQSLRRSRT